MAKGQRGTRAEVERRLIEKATRDAAFRQRLVAEPRRTIEAELGGTVPPGVTVRVLEERPGEYYLVLPAVGGAIGKLTDQQLGTVAGGGSSQNSTVWSINMTM